MLNINDSIFATLNFEAEDCMPCGFQEKFKFKLLMPVIKMQCKTGNFDYKEILNILERL